MPAGAPAMVFCERAKRPVSYSALVLSAFFGSFSLLVGCAPEDPIVVERIPKTSGSTLAAASQPTQESRMLAAIIPRDEQAIFFKVMGPEAIVASKKTDFFNLIQSVTFDDGEARWQLPEGWRQQEGTGERLATLSVPTDPPLAVSVTSLPLRDTDDIDGYLLANINRWRGQMGFPELPPEKLHTGGDVDEETVTAKLADGTEATLVNIVGQSQGGMMPGLAMPTSPQPPARGDRPSGLSYDVPSSWKSLGGSGISQATFVADDARVTTTALSAASNQLVPNINRWREQVGLAPQSDDEVENSIESITLGDGRQGQYVTLVSPEDQDPQEAILGVIAVRGGTMWFVKMTGSAQTVLAEKPNFESFLKSLKLPQGG